jgi:hypothetical protein
MYQINAIFMSVEGKEEPLLSFAVTLKYSAHLSLLRKVLLASPNGCFASNTAQCEGYIGAAKSHEAIDPEYCYCRLYRSNGTTSAFYKPPFPTDGATHQASAINRT